MFVIDYWTVMSALMYVETKKLMVKIFGFVYFTSYAILFRLGYGRNEKEANGNCIRNLLEFLLEDEQIFSVFNEYLTNSNSNSYKLKLLIILRILLNWNYLKIFQTKNQQTWIQKALNWLTTNNQRSVHNQLSHKRFKHLKE